MNAANLKLADDDGPPPVNPGGAEAATPEDALWLPPKRMWRYQAAKLLVGALVAAIFAFWMLMQWANGTIRFITGLLVALTLWVTVKSVVVDSRRGKNRQIAIQKGTMYVTSPKGLSVVPLAEVGLVQWREEPEAAVGLWFYDAQKKILGHVGQQFLADEAEARVFLGWARRLSGLPMMARWPSVADR